MPGREPRKHSHYFNPSVTWILVILVGIAVIAVGLILFREKPGAGGRTDSSPRTAVTEGREIQWRIYNEGIAEVDGTSKFAMIYFDTTECPPCQRIKTLTFNDPEVQKRIQALIVPIRIESASGRKASYMGQELTEAALTFVFAIPGYPTTVFYDGKRKQTIFMLPGVIKKEKLLLIFDYLQSRAFDDPDATLETFLTKRGYTE